MGHRAHARVQKVNKEGADNPMDKTCLPWQEASIPKYQHSETKILMINTDKYCWSRPAIPTQALS